MNELALHILDIAQNSISAGANRVVISVLTDPMADSSCISVEDNGRGMDAQLLQRVTSPFATTRTTRKVGLGIPLLKMTAEMTGGRFEIESEPGKGTRLAAHYVPSSVDMLPLGDMGATMMLLVQQRPDIHFIYRRQLGPQGFTLDTAEVSAALEGLPLDTPEVLDFIQGYVCENEAELTQQG